MISRPFVTLLVSPDRTLLRRLTKFLEVFGYDMRQAVDPTQAALIAEGGPIDFLIADSECDARSIAQLCRNIRRLSPDAYVYSLLLAQQRDLRTLTDALESGYDDFLMQPVVYGELLARLRTGARVIEFERRLEEQAGVDASTGLLDRLALELRLQERLQAGDANASALAILDIDSFSRVSRLHGEAVAKKLNLELAEVLRKATIENESLAALHANRFALAFTTTSMLSAAERVNELRSAIAEHKFSSGAETVALTASAGITLLRTKERPAQSLERAERALDLAKASGRNLACTSDDVEDEVEAWAESAASGRLFESTLARDVMLPCPLLLQAEETLDQAHSLLVQTQLINAPVVDSEGRLLGITSIDEVASNRPRTGKVRSSSIRLLRHVMSTDVATFEETASLGTLMEFFTADGRELVVIVRDNKPLGLVTCQGLAALNERLSFDRFVPCGVASPGSEYLVVPDLPKLETE